MSTQTRILRPAATGTAAATIAPPLPLMTETLLDKRAKLPSLAPSAEQNSNFIRSAAYDRTNGRMSVA